jgi:hypothetical protein
VAERDLVKGRNTFSSKKISSRQVPWKGNVHEPNNLAEDLYKCGFLNSFRDYVRGSYKLLRQ